MNTPEPLDIGVPFEKLAIDAKIIRDEQGGFLSMIADRGGKLGISLQLPPFTIAANNELADALLERRNNPNETLVVTIKIAEREVQP